MRRARRSRPAAFCSRAPFSSGAGPTGLSPARLDSRAARTARTICSGPSNRCAGGGPTSARPSSSRSQIRIRSAVPSSGASTCSGTRGLQCGSQVASPCSRTGTGSSVSRRSAVADRAARPSTGPATRPAPRSSASRPAIRTSPSASDDETRVKSSPRTGRPEPCNAAAAAAADDRRPRSRMYTSRISRPSATVSRSATGQS